MIAPRMSAAVRSAQGFRRSRLSSSQRVSLRRATPKIYVSASSVSSTSRSMSPTGTPSEAMRAGRASPSRRSARRSNLPRLFGAGSAADLEPLEGANAEHVRRAVESATIEVLSGKDDRLLRRLSIETDFGVDVPDDMRKALGASQGSTSGLTSRSRSRMKRRASSRRRTRSGTRVSRATSRLHRQRRQGACAAHRARYGSVCTITSAIAGCSRRMRPSISLARACASASARSGSSASVRNASRPPSVR